MKLRNRTPFISLSLIALAILISGCGKKQEACRPAPHKAVTPAAPATRDPGVQVAVVPDADLLYYLDIAAMRETPIMKVIREKRAAEGKTAPAQMDEDDWSKIKKLTGLDEEDLVSLLISADLDTFDIDNRMSQELKQLKGACAIALAKPLTHAKVQECMRIMSSKSQLEEIELAGRPVVRVLSSSPKEPVIYTTVSATEKTLFIAVTESAMEGMLQRDSEGQSATPDPELTRLGATITDGAQMRLLLLASDPMRAKIAGLIDGAADSNPQQKQSKRGIMAGFFSPLRNTRNIVLWAKAAEAIDLRFALELGTASEAQQCAHLIQSFIVPMIGKSFESTDPENKMQIDDSLDAINEDNMLVFTLQVTEQDVQNWQQPGS